MSVCIAADGDLKAGPGAVEIARRRAAFHVCSLPLLFVFIVPLLSPSIPQPGVNKKKKDAVPVWSLRDQRRGKYHFHNI